MSSNDFTYTAEPVAVATVTRPAEQALVPQIPSPEEILEGDPVWEATEVWVSPDGSKMSGAFRSTPGRFKWYQAFHETTYMMAGHMIVTFEDGTSISLKAGDMVHLLPHTRCEIEVVETVHDFFVVTSTDGPVAV
ncbi:cupin domain-containing protein [Streptomyces sp. BH106]|uniref:cupin domain-containing protein n=1 Tax=Streptomyces sp. BH106 TaxID=3410409 RepID=UPI003CF2A848